jgi:hypothetical protein
MVAQLHDSAIIDKYDHLTDTRTLFTTDIYIYMASCKQLSTGRLLGSFWCNVTNPSKICIIYMTNYSFSGLLNDGESIVKQKVKINERVAIILMIGVEIPPIARSSHTVALESSRVLLRRQQGAEEGKGGNK